MAITAINHNLLPHSQVIVIKFWAMMFYSLILAISCFISSGCGLTGNEKSSTHRELNQYTESNSQDSIVDRIQERREFDPSRDTVSRANTQIESIKKQSKFNTESQVSDENEDVTINELEEDKIFSNKEIKIQRGESVVIPEKNIREDPLREDPLGEGPLMQEDKERDQDKSPDGTKETQIDRSINTKVDRSEYTELDEILAQEDQEPIYNEQHTVWQDILDKYVSPLGVVDYKGLNKNVSDLDAYLSLLSQNVPSSSDLSDNAKAYWLNAYNAFTIKLILNHYPVKSIRDIDSGAPWDTKWIKLGSKTYSLNNIEHNIIRPIWNDARIHFAVNCAAKSCPPLSNIAFTKNNTEKMLDELSRKFISDTNFNQVSVSDLKLSKIFEWYQDDFGDLVKFIDKYVTINVSSNANVTYIEYDWSLNDH